ncbi:MATE family efflux transporter, partial [Ruminococcaceae bacterium OttesenSCG-928-L11]|nr:MATE family efflux transporter [Ruminococcaceae bacterium OttesenSCG-928-L11]
SCLNIALDLLFVVVFGMGVAGLALATIMAQMISVILILLRIRSGGYGVVINRKHSSLTKPPPS